MTSALKREFKVGDEVCHTNKFSTGNNFRKRRQGVVLALEKRPVKGGKLRATLKFSGTLVAYLVIMHLMLFYY